MKNSLLHKVKKAASYLLCLALFASSTVTVSAIADLEAPSDVENLEATAQDGAVALTWDVAIDNVGVAGYKVYYGLESVRGEQDQYVFDVDAGDVISYSVEDLENGVTYYFAVTAYDEAGNESENYSLEASATPTEAATPVVQPSVAGGTTSLGDDGKAPSVKDVEGFSKVQIKVTFSEPVSLPEEEPQTAFLVENSLTGEQLALLDAEVMKDDLTSVILETVPQDVASEYTVTAGIMVEDRYENSVRSGTSDTGTYLAIDGAYIDVLGEDEEAPVQEDVLVEIPEVAEEIAEISEDNLTASTDTEVPEVVEESDALIVEVLSETELRVAFDAPITLETALTHFTIADAMGNAVTVSSEEVDATDASIVYLQVEGLKAGTDYTLEIANVNYSATGDAVDAGSATFSTPTMELKDVIAPEDVTSLLVTIEEEIVRLTWVVSVSPDAVEQVVYQSTDGLNFMQKALLAPLATSYEPADLVAGMKYWFKVTSRDGAGNESDGVVVQVELPETGPGLMLLLGLSAGATAILKRRKA